MLAQLNPEVLERVGQWDLRVLLIAALIVVPTVMGLTLGAAIRMLWKTYTSEILSARQRDRELVDLVLKAREALAEQVSVLEQLPSIIHAETKDWEDLRAKVLGDSDSRARRLEERIESFLRDLRDLKGSFPK